MNYSFLDDWALRSFGKEYFKRAPTIIFEVFNQFSQPKSEENQQQQQKSNEVVTKQSDKQKEQNPFYRYLNKGNQSMLQMLLMKYLKLR